MSIQKRLLLIYTVIYSVTFVLVALIIYTLPRTRLLAEIDTSLNKLASEIRPSNTRIGPGGLQINIPNDLANFETASTFLIIIDENGNIVAGSSNISGLRTYLDPDGLQDKPHYDLVRHGDALLRVLSAPLIVQTETESVIVGHLQVARLLDNYDSFNRLLGIALIIGFGAALLSMIIAARLTPSLFKPLENIVEVTQQITRADDLSRRIPDNGRTDELGDLTRAINHALERLERLFRAQQRLLADVSHELRTPLTTIRGNADLMQQMGEYDPELLQIIQEESKRMARLVGDLLLLARADAGGLPLARQIIELDTLFFEVYRKFIVLQEQENVSVTIKEVDQAVVMGDPDRLKQVFINLIDNAIKYTPSGGEVYLRLSKEDGWVQVDVSDTGIGIPENDLPHIFDRFYRVDKARSRAQGGSGLGLSIARWIIQEHGGMIRATSKVGEGTTFSIKLPLYNPQVTEESSPEAIVEAELEKIRPRLRLRNNNDH